MAFACLLVPASHHLFVSCHSFTCSLVCEIGIDTTHVDALTLAFLPVDVTPARFGPWLNAFAFGAGLVFPVAQILVVANARLLAVLLVIAIAPVLPRTFQ
jgi:hypothetical protein